MAKATRLKGVKKTNFLRIGNLWVYFPQNCRMTAFHVLPFGKAKNAQHETHAEKKAYISGKNGEKNVSFVNVY